MIHFGFITKMHSQKKWFLLEPFFVLYMETKGIEPLKWFFTIGQPLNNPKRFLKEPLKVLNSCYRTLFWFLVESLKVPYRGQVKNPLRTSVVKNKHIIQNLSKSTIEP